VGDRTQSLLSSRSGRKSPTPNQQKCGNLSKGRTLPEKKGVNWRGLPGICGEWGKDGVGVPTGFRSGRMEGVAT